MSSEICMLTNIQKGSVSDPNLGMEWWREGKREWEKEEDRRQECYEIIDFLLFGLCTYLFSLFGLEGCVIVFLLEGLKAKSSHHILITRYIL